MSQDDNSRIDIICLPTEAGTHNAGQRKAPAALLHTGGLATKLGHLSYHVSIHDQVLTDTLVAAAAAWQPSPKTNGVRNEANTLSVMRAVHRYLLRHHRKLHHAFPLILGGDCSITPAIFSALKALHTDQKVGLLYIDGDADLTLPSQTSAEGSSGILDSMTITHLTGRPGGLESMRSSSFRNEDGTPLVDPENIVLVGFDPLQPAVEHWTYLLEQQYKVFTRPTVAKDPVGSAEKALAWLKERCDVVYVHFDVDVIDSGEFPLANYPHYAGLEFEAAMSVLGTVLGSEVVKGLTITEVNPNNDPDGEMVTRLVDGVVEGIKRRKR